MQSKMTRSGCEYVMCTVHFIAQFLLRGWTFRQLSWINNISRLGTMDTKIRFIQLQHVAFSHRLKTTKESIQRKKILETHSQGPRPICIIRPNYIVHTCCKSQPPPMVHRRLPMALPYACTSVL